MRKKIKIKRRIKKWLAIMLLFFYAFSFEVATASWDLLDFDSGALSEMQTVVQNNFISTFGIDETEARYMVQTMNVSRTKKSPPTVSLVFSPQNPTDGKKVTAVATPAYFTTAMENLYFTWFLKTKGCNEDDNPNADQRLKCDLDKNGKIDIEDYKIKATRILVNGGFDFENELYMTNTDKDGYKAVIGGDDQKGKKSYCYVHDTKSGDEFPITCGHLFPNAKENNCRNEGDVCEVTGDGSFGKEEEKFWRTDPHSNDTAQTGNFDEANVAGKGLNVFSWNYSEGDKVGVVVEGASIEPNQTKDSSYRTLWAMPNGMCETEEVEDYAGEATEIISETEFEDGGITYVRTISEKTVWSVAERAANIAKIKYIVTTTTTVTNKATGEVVSQTSSTANPTYNMRDIRDSLSLKDIEKVSDLNSCLYDNLISPAEHGPQNQKFEIGLTYSPNSPINDPGDYDKPELSNGDQVVVNASVLNVNDSNYVQYEWELFQGDEPNPDSWGKPIPKLAIPNATQMVGIGIDTFKFKLNFGNDKFGFPEPKKYLRVKLTVKENVGENLFRKGNADVVIPISSTTTKIKAYQGKVIDQSSSKLGFDGAEICSSGKENVLCPVSPNQIVGIEVDGAGLSDFMWKINGKVFSYQECFFNACGSKEKGEATNVAFFPVLEDQGKKYTVNLTAMENSTGKKINLTRSFLVAEPKINISSADEKTCKPVLLGKYIDLDGTEWKDYSDINFWALTNSEIKLKAEPIGFSQKAKDFKWRIDGVEIDFETASSKGFQINEDGILTLPAKEDGESYNIAVGTIYSQDNLVKKALKKHWNVDFDQFYEKPVNDSIVVAMQNFAPEISQNPTKKIFASVFSALPAQMAFMLRILLTGFLLLTISKFILSFFPKFKNEN